MELVVVIAIIGILAGIAIPRFMEATASARGSKILADMRTIESSVIIYYAKEGQYPKNQEAIKIAKLIQGDWPVPPIGSANIKYANDTGSKTIEVTPTSAYVYNGPVYDDTGKLTTDYKVQLDAGGAKYSLDDLTISTN